LRELLNRYGMLLVLVALCALFSVLTLKEQMPKESAAVAELVERIDEGFVKTATIVALGAKNTDSAPLAEIVGRALAERGFTDVHVVV